MNQLLPYGSLRLLMNRVEMSKYLIPPEGRKCRCFSEDQVNDSCQSLPEYVSRFREIALKIYLLYEVAILYRSTCVLKIKLGCYRPYKIF